jgi:hypothetical protein
VYLLLGPGFVSAQTQAQAGSDLVHLVHASGVQITLAAMHDAYGSFGSVHLYGTKGQLPLRLTDTYHAFRGQLVAFVDMLHTGSAPFEFSQTVELMAIIIAGIRSRENGGAKILIQDIVSEVQ